MKPLPGVDLGHASQVGGVVGEDVTAQAFFGRFALVRARSKESVDVRRGAGAVVQEPRGFVDLRRPCNLFVLGYELSPHFPAAKLKTVSDLKLYLVQELGEGTRINPFMVLQVVHMRGRGSLGEGFPLFPGKEEDTPLAKGFRALDEAAVIPDDGYNLFPPSVLAAGHGIGRHVKNRKAVSLGLRFRFQNAAHRDIVPIPRVDRIVRRSRIAPAISGALLKLGFGQRLQGPVHTFHAMAARRLEIEGVKGEGKFGFEIGVEAQVIVNDDGFAVHKREDKIIVHMFS